MDITFDDHVKLMIILFMYWTGSKSGAGSIPPEAAGRSRPGDARKPFGYKGPDSEGSQVHDSQSAVRRTGMIRMHDQQDCWLKALDD